MTPTQFTDKHGKTWDCTLTLGIAEEIDASDFTSLTDKKFTILDPTKELFQTLLTKMRVTFAVIWVIVREQAKANLDIDPTLSPENESKAQKLFIKSLDPSSMEGAKKAFFNALGDFFPDWRTGLSTLVSQMSKGQAAIENQMTEVMPEMETWVTNQLTRHTAALKAALKSEDPKALENLEKLLDADAGGISSSLLGP